MPGEGFTMVRGLAAPIPEDNIDTDIIFPARFLLITARKGLGRYAFHDRRFAADGSEIADFVLNDARFREPKFLVTGANFGSGSSREQAVWALHGLGVRVIVAPSFGEIFAGNCLRNGIVPIVQPQAVVDELMDAARAGKTFAVNLENQSLQADAGPALAFSIAPERRLALINGWDETDQIANQYAGDIAAFEARQRQAQPWLYPMEEPA